MPPEGEEEQEEQVVPDPPAPPADPAPPTPPAADPKKETDTDAMFKMMIEDLKEEVGDIDLSSLSLKDQMVALRAMKKAKKEPAAPPIEKKKKGDLPGEEPEIPEFEYVPLWKKNARGSVFDQKLKEMRSVGSDILDKLV